MVGTYKVVFECDKKMTLTEVKPEGHGLEKTKITVGLRVTVGRVGCCHSRRTSGQPLLFQ